MLNRTRSSTGHHPKHGCRYDLTITISRQINELRYAFLGQRAYDRVQYDDLWVILCEINVGKKGKILRTHMYALESTALLEGEQQSTFSVHRWLYASYPHIYTWHIHVCLADWYGYSFRFISIYLPSRSQMSL